MCGRPDGGLEARKEPVNGKWEPHLEFKFGGASVPILIVDVNQDGKNDIIVGQGHGYGLDWYEQRAGKNGKSTWIKPSIDPFNAQYHSIHCVDITGETGKASRRDRDGQSVLISVVAIAINIT